MMEFYSDEMQRRIRATVDKEEIRSAVFRYCQGIDRGDADLMRSAYHEDAIEHHGNFYEGPAREYCGFVVEHLQDCLIARHELTNISIELDGDKAKVESYFISTQRMPDREEDDFTLARYLDRFSFKDGNWLISERWVVYDWSMLVLPGTESPYAASFPAGKRDRTDLLWQL